MTISVDLGCLPTKRWIEFPEGRVHNRSLNLKFHKLHLHKTKIFNGCMKLDQEMCIQARSRDINPLPQNSKLLTKRL